METSADQDRTRRHLKITRPSPWVLRFAPLVAARGSVLDLACGGGRHGRWFLEHGHRVTFLDRDVEPVADLAGREGADVIEADLEDGSPWPLAGRRFDAVVVSNYLHRPLFPSILESLTPGGVLIYETFARGNEAYARPRNPDHLLRSGELLDWVRGRLQVVAYEHGIDETGPIAGVKGRICAVANLGSITREDGEPDPLGVHVDV